MAIASSYGFHGRTRAAIGHARALNGAVEERSTRHTGFSFHFDQADAPTKQPAAEARKSSSYAQGLSSFYPQVAHVILAMLLPIYNNERGCAPMRCHLPATFGGIQARRFRLRSK
jgi:hypothetical protein